MAEAARVPWRTGSNQHALSLTPFLEFHAESILFDGQRIGTGRAQARNLHVVVRVSLGVKRDLTNPDKDGGLDLA